MLRCIVARFGRSAWIRRLSGYDRLCRPCRIRGIARYAKGYINGMIFRYILKCVADDASYGYSIHHNAGNNVSGIGCNGETLAIPFAYCYTTAGRNSPANPSSSRNGVYLWYRVHWIHRRNRSIARSLKGGVCLVSSYSCDIVIPDCATDGIAIKIAIVNRIYPQAKAADGTAILDQSAFGIASCVTLAKFRKGYRNQRGQSSPRVIFVISTYTPSLSP